MQESQNERIEFEFGSTTGKGLHNIMSVTSARVF